MIRRFAVCLFGMLVLFGSANAWTIRKSQNNFSPINLDMIGGVPTMVDQSSTPALAGNTTGWILSIWMSSGDYTNFVNLRDTGTANISSAMFLPPLRYGTTPQIIEYKNPPSFTNGLSVNIDSTVACMVLTLQMNDTYFYFMPISNNNIPAQDTALVGVSVSTVNQTTTAIMVASSPVTPSLLYGFHRSTGATTEYIEFRDTGTANTTSALALPKILFSPDGTFPGEIADLRSLKYPVRFRNGMSVNTSVSSRLLSVFFRRSTQNRPR